MSKAILIMDMPKYCSECQLCVALCGKEIAVCTGTTGTEKKDGSNEGRPTWCPLREVPQKKPCGDYTSLIRIGERKGYNACIDELLGGGE